MKLEQKHAEKVVKNEQNKLKKKQEDDMNKIIEIADNLEALKSKVDQADELLNVRKFFTVQEIN